jgi:hypothetical protein
MPAKKHSSEIQEEKKESKSLLRKITGERSIEKSLSTLGIIYFIIGLVFAFCFAIYYKWETVGYFSPGFYMVIFTWPYQAIGFIKDLLYYGLAGKPI